MSAYKVALVTGATGGIGSAIAKKLVEQGLKVVVTGRNADKLNSLVEELNRDNVVYYDTFDVNDYEAMKNFVEQLKMKNIEIDILVNNAGLALGLASFQEYDVSDMITMLDTNVKSLMLLSHLLVKGMVERNNGIIINIGSTAGQFAYPNGSVYCASKAAVKTLSDGMRVDLMATDVKVTTIMPGLVETDFSLVRFKGDNDRAKTVYQGIDALQGIDVAEAVWYVVNQPKRVQVSEIALLANQQGNGFTNFKK
ncbi:3-hydroxy acid dehydrogenase/malonic semialdehyde reductase [Bacilli bacterium PM5-3]|nr:3-hydroxy acid dehydrogenase/malonic semialdehyde reductase [Bacilli bacterium PM5-3]MDH6603386.1 3-hydroxy acid dehydrogenase/malonic semialdehyde reductase [Bacilli bacterium PM5-9]